MLVGTTLVLSWKYPCLRAQGLMLFAAAIVAWFASPLEASVKVYAYLAIDIAGGACAYYLWRKYSEWTALGFLALSLLCVIAHWALFWTHPANPNPWIASLNGIFSAMCIMVGGDGYARRNRHLFSERRDNPIGEHAHKGNS